MKLVSGPLTSHHSLIRILMVTMNGSSLRPNYDPHEHHGGNAGASAVYENHKERSILKKTLRHHYPYPQDYKHRSLRTLRKVLYTPPHPEIHRSATSVFDVLFLYQILVMRQLLGIVGTRTTVMLC